ncbi:MAG: hypothetical protein QXD43_00350 [Candidatus Aenigmatarchaeota archaeon]
MSLFSHDEKLIGTYKKRIIKIGEDHPRTFYILYEEFKPAMKNVEIDNYTISKNSENVPTVAIPLSQLGKKITSNCVDEVWVEGFGECNPISMKMLKEIFYRGEKATVRMLRGWLKENELDYDLESNELKRAARFINSLRKHIELK